MPGRSPARVAYRPTGVIASASSRRVTGITRRSTASARNSARLGRTSPSAGPGRIGGETVGTDMAVILPVRWRRPGRLRRRRDV